MPADNITAIRETCKCGHDICTHYDQLGVRVNCLAINCECKCYVNEWEDDAEEGTDPGIAYRQSLDDYDRSIRSRPHADWQCRCRACLIFDARFP